MMTTEGDEFCYHEMIAHIPMMHHKAPKTVLVGVPKGIEGPLLKPVPKFSIHTNSLLLLIIFLLSPSVLFQCIFW